MRDLCDVFEEMEKGLGKYQYTEPEDTGVPFHKVLEIVDQDNDDRDDE